MGLFWSQFSLTLFVKVSLGDPVLTATLTKHLHCRLSGWVIPMLTRLRLVLCEGDIRVLDGDGRCAERACCLAFLGGS